ncbi:hypothetical protein DRH14_01680, partial [Candidatus Shapirobacteria bacterium]
GGVQIKTGQLVRDLAAVIEAAQLSKFNEVLEELKRALLPSSKPKEESSEKESIWDLMFVKPYKERIETFHAILRKVADKDPERALKMLEAMPDGSIALINMMNSAARLMAALGTMLEKQAAQRRSESRDVSREVEKMAKKLKEEKEEKEERVEESGEVEPVVNMEIEEDESGFVVGF